MDSFYGFDAGKAADAKAFPRIKVPTPDEIDAHIREGQRLRAEVTAAGLSAAFRALVWPLRVLGGAIGRWHERGQLRQARREQKRIENELMAYKDSELDDIGIHRPQQASCCRMTRSIAGRC